MSDKQLEQLIKQEMITIWFMLTCAVYRGNHEARVMFNCIQPRYMDLYNRWGELTDNEHACWKWREAIDWPLERTFKGADNGSDHQSS